MKKNGKWRWNIELNFFFKSLDNNFIWSGIWNDIDTVKDHEIVKEMVELIELIYAKETIPAMAAELKSIAVALYSLRESSGGVKFNWMQQFVKFIFKYISTEQ